MHVKFVTSNKKMELEKWDDTLIIIFEVEISLGMRLPCLPTCMCIAIFMVVTK